MDNGHTLKDKNAAANNYGCEHGYCVRRSEVQTWSLVLLCKCSAD